MYDHAHLFRKPEVPGYNHSHLVKYAASAFAPALGGAGLGALAAHTLGGSPWLGTLLGGGAGYLGADYINDAFGLGQPQPSAQPPGAGGPPINPRIPQTVGPGETMTAPPRDPLAISRSPDSMLPETLPKPPAYSGAVAPGSLRPPPSHASTVAPGSVRPPAAPQTRTMDALYNAAAPAQPQTPFGLDPGFLQYLGLAQEFGGMSPDAAQQAILRQRPELRGITPSERLNNNQSAEMRALRERHERQRTGQETWSDWLAKWLPGWS